MLTKDTEQENYKYDYKNVGELKGSKVPVQKGCPNKTCYCTGECKKVVGYRDKLPGEI